VDEFQNRRDPDRSLFPESPARRQSRVSVHRNMSDFSVPFQIALQLILRFDVDLREIIFLSLAVSLTGSVCAFAIGAPLGTALAIYRFPGRNMLVVIANTLLGLPPVVVGLAVYVLLSRSGPLGSLGLLFTPAAMMIAQAALGTRRSSSRSSIGSRPGCGGLTATACWSAAHPGFGRSDP
jgi:ABC-type glycerol-3-phosphate transport system permease component